MVGSIAGSKKGATFQVKLDPWTQQFAALGTTTLRGIPDGLQSESDRSGGKP
jgi:hypothetical protein